MMVKEIKGGFHYIRSLRAKEYFKKTISKRPCGKEGRGAGDGGKCRLCIYSYICE